MKNNISTEDLLKALDNVTTSDIKINDFNGFINTFNLKPGTNKIKTTALYQLYSKWSKDSIGKAQFINNVNLAFEVKKSIAYINLEPLAIIQLIDNNSKSHKLISNSPASKKHIEAFIEKFELEKGYLWIKFSVLYDVYDKWRKENKLKSRLAKNSLKDFLNLYFEEKKDSKERYFGLDPKVLNNLTSEQKLQCLSQKSKTNAIKKENQKKSN